MLETILMLLAGLAVLTSGAEVLVRGASGLAAAARISPLVIGLTVVAYGTSTPELVVSVQSSLRDQADIALGNVIGSNIFNVLFILGLSALIIPLRVSQQLVRFDVPLMVGFSTLVGIMAWDRRIGWIDGAVLTASLIVYTWWGIRQSRREQSKVQKEYDDQFGGNPATPTRGWVFQVMQVIAGLVLLVIGSRWFTDSAITIAREFGLSELVIGLTIVAAGTSMPEVATSLLAAFRGQRDIAVGNVVGSNLFNIMGVLGLSGILSGSGIVVSDAAFSFDIPVMIAVAFACLPIFFTGHVIARWEGALFLGYCAAYITYLVLAQTNAAVTRTFAGIMCAFVIPLTAITIALTVTRSLRRSS